MHTQTLTSIALSPAPARCRIRVTPRGEHLCVEAADAVRAGETILVFTGRRVRRPDRHSIQVGPRTHIAAPEGIPWDMAVADYGWRYLNHSCEPNAHLRGIELVALVDVPEGDEVTFDYNTTEWDMARPFDCRCRTPSCVGVVRGYRHLDESARARLHPFLASHLRLRG
ncbi:MAG TPA: SET domain-containing protein-lysine N-methyltransferase [Longimicrobiales bacterium]|nr:SET domain-containing protein-lysine N-methyltransferase [Longimicrobiales bacterium]